MAHNMILYFHLPYCHVSIVLEFLHSTLKLITLILSSLTLTNSMTTQIARFMGTTWGLPGSCWPQMGPMLAQWTMLLGNQKTEQSSKNNAVYAMSPQAKSIQIPTKMCKFHQWGNGHSMREEKLHSTVHFITIQLWSTWSSSNYFCCNDYWRNHMASIRNNSQRRGTLGQPSCRSKSVSVFQNFKMQLDPAK